MVRVLHTGDWHLGQTLRGHSREREQREVLARVVAIAEEREVDCLVLAGDVFDAHNPSGEALRLFYDAMVALSRASPRMTTVVVAGNHDAAGRLEAPHPLLAAFGVRVVGSVRRLDGRALADRHLVPVLDGRGREAVAHVLAVSHPTAACLRPDPAADGAGSPVARAVRRLYDELVEGVRDRLGGLPLIVTGHLHVAGGLESEGAERRILVGGQHAVPHDAFPREAAYVALGHLHRAQSVGREGVRYCGSLLPLSATEQPYRHGVSIVDLDEGGVRAVEHVPLPRPVAFLRLPEAGEARLSDLGDRLAALGLPADLPADERPFVQLRLSREGLGTDAREEVERVAARFPVRLVDVKVSPPPDAAPPTSADAAFARLADLDPARLFALAFERRFGRPPDAAHLDVFHRARAGVPA